MSRNVGWSCMSQRFGKAMRATGLSCQSESDSLLVSHSDERPVIGPCFCSCARTFMAALSQVAADTFQRRRMAGLTLVDQAEAIALACYDMAQRFHQGGKLIAFGNGGSSTDAQHIAVEFLHPVTVGKRALPAISLTNDIATLT